MKFLDHCRNAATSELDLALTFGLDGLIIREAVDNSLALDYFKPFRLFLKYELKTKESKYQNRNLAT